MKFKYNLKQKANNRNHASTKKINHTKNTLRENPCNIEGL